MIKAVSFIYVFMYQNSTNRCICSSTITTMLIVFQNNFNQNQKLQLNIFIFKLQSNMRRQDSQKYVSALTANFHQGEENQVQQVDSAIQWTQNHPSSPNEEDLQKLHMEYINEKLNRKKQFQKFKRDRFGASSSEEDDVGASQSDSDSSRRQSNLEEEKRFRESDKLHEAKIQRQNRCQIFFSIKKIKQNWTPQNLQFNEQSLIISQKPYFLKQFHKIKIIQGCAIEDCHKIKLSTIDENQIFIAASCKPYQQLPCNYYIFAFVIQQKLLNMGRKLFKCINPTMPGIPETLIKNSYNFGRIYKKSQILGKWQERLIVINKEGIFSYKKFNEKHSMFIAGGSVKQIWTRFQIQQKLLVIKVLHSSSTKTQFGIPLTETLDRRSWLFSFYLLAFPQ